MQTTNQKYHIMRLLKRRGCSALILPLLVGTMAQSCVNEPGTDGKDKLDKVESQYFNFETKKDITLNLNFGPYAANALFSVYIENPYDEDENIIREADFRIFADKDGKYNGSAKLPSYISNVWVQVSAFGVPAMTKVAVTDGVVRIDVNDMSNIAKAPYYRIKDSEEYELRKAYGDSDPGYRIFSYIDWYTNSDSHGHINYSKYSNLFSNGKLTPEEVIGIRNVLWQGNASKPAANHDGLNNSYLLRYDTDLINTNIGDTYTDADGTIKTLKSAKVYMTFLHESAELQNTIGYYYYKSGDVPGGGLREIDKYVIIPNASTSDNKPYYSNGTAPLQPYGVNNAQNLRTQLLFLDPEDGKLKEEFPAGYTIGYFIVPNGWDDNKKTIMAQNKWGIYTNRESNWNLVEDASWAGLGNLARGFISVKLPNGSLLYGVEDKYSDLSYDDVLFTIDTEPATAIKQDDRPTLVPKDEEVYTTETTYNTYAYEDVWPYGGDYDLNDVIIQHKREIVFGCRSNDIVKIIDTFTPVQPAGSAGFQDAFAIQLGINSSMVESTQLSDGMVYEDDTNCVIVTENASADRGKPLTITRTMKRGLSKAEISEDINPFIIASYKKGDMARTEVHLPKHKATSRANKNLNNTGKDAFYIDRDGAFPFAISLPVKDFTPAPEAVRIDKVYTKFNNWASSNGKQDADWYLKK